MMLIQDTEPESENIPPDHASKDSETALLYSHSSPSHRLIPSIGSCSRHAFTATPVCFCLCLSKLIKLRVYYYYFLRVSPPKRCTDVNVGSDGGR